MVLFAVVLPLILLLGVIAVDVGNWFVHQRRLQTIVDAAAFAGGGAFNGCFQDATATNALIRNTALKYAGDTARDSTTLNTQAQTPNKTRVVLNSSRYWDGGTDPYLPGTNGYGLDDSWATPGDPCSTRALDVKATDDVAPLLFGFIPVAASPHARARVEIHKVVIQSGLLPWGVPEADPKAVAAIFVNEDSGAVMATLGLNKQTLPVNDPLSPWAVWRGDLLNFQVNSNNIGVVILTSKDTNPSLTGTLGQICGQNPAQTRCYSGSSSNSGLSFIHGFSGQNGTITIPVPKQVEPDNLTCSNDLSAPYYLLNGDCAERLRAVIDFGSGSANPTLPPTCALVTSSQGGDMTWSDGGLGGTLASGGLGTWTSSSFTLPANSGRTQIDLSWWSGPRANGTCGNPGQHPNNGSLTKVAAPFVANDFSGPIEYLWINNLNPPPLAANDIARGTGKNFEVTVGLAPPLSVSTATDPPIYLRLTTNRSETQAVDCDRNENFRNEILNGCQTPYAINERSGDCSNYGQGSLPPGSTNPSPVPDCVAVQTGVSQGQITSAIKTRFGSPCTANNWPNNNVDPLPDQSDPRWVNLFVVDTGSFSGSGNDIFPVRRFAGFYLTGADGLNCPGDDPPPASGIKASAWGHFVTYVIPDPNATHSDQLCAFDEVGTCIAVLVE